MRIKGAESRGEHFCRSRVISPSNHPDSFIWQSEPPVLSHYPNIVPPLNAAIVDSDNIFPAEDEIWNFWNVIGQDHSSEKYLCYSGNGKH